MHRTTTPSTSAADAPSPGHPGTPCGCRDFRVGRRWLLGAAAATTGVLAGAQLFGEAFRQVAYGAEPGGNVVVVLSLRGGADGLSMVVPATAADQSVLQQVRPDIYLPAAGLIAGDDRFGLHPAFAPLAGMWSRSKNLAAVHAVGLPAPNRSHFDAMAEIEDADPGDPVRTGWINRTVGLGASPRLEDAVQVGTVLPPTSLAGPAPSLAVKHDSDLSIAPLGVPAQARADSVTAMWQDDTDLVGESVRSVVGSMTRLAPLARAVSPAGGSLHSSAYPEGPLRDVLADTSALIRADLGARFVTLDYGDWDMHQGLGRPDGGWMHDQVTHLAGSLRAFFDDLGPDAERVTVVTMSEFGRRVAQNANAGLDHGYGNAMLLLGAGVNGGQVHGPWTGLDQLADGDVTVQTSFQSVLWEVLRSRFPELSGSQNRIFPSISLQSLGAMR